MKFQAALGAKFAKGFEASSIRRGVEFAWRRRSCGFSVSDSLKACSSPEMISNEWIGSASDASLVSIRCTSRRVRSTWRRKRMPRPAPSCAPSIRPGQVGDDEGAAEFAAFATGAAVGVDHAEIGFERGERIIRDFRARGGNHRNQRGFAGVGETDQADVGE